ncbi:MAG: hypothetical protein HY788_01400 [Deltaproteobacteria bacterium]|nr:hypothetical protein [Deltaproteobacteria bacterium]
MILCFVLSLMFAFTTWFVFGTLAIPPDPVQQGNEDPPDSPHRFTRAQVTQLVSRIEKRLDEETVFVIAGQNARPLYLQTTIDLEVQKKIKNLLEQSGAEAGAVVVVNPQNGRVTALADFGRADGMPVWSARFPAASIFKIITAAAALEEGAVTPESKIPFSGGKYTLYKKNLKLEANRYSQYVRFDGAFAQSINSIFGKVGLHLTGPKILAKYARLFGFEEKIQCDVPIETSCLLVPESDFQVAELASGYNRVTQISPIHAASLPVAVLNDGIQPVVSVVDKIRDADDHNYYLGPVIGSERIISADSARQLRTLMQATIEKGTCSRAFRNIRRYTQHDLAEVGGKTGNIGNEEHTLRYEWFVGYVLDKKENRSMALAVLMIHGDRLGFRAHRIGATLVKDFLCSEVPWGSAGGTREQASARPL